MAGIPASVYTGATERALTARLRLAPDALPAGGNWYPEEAVLELMVDLAEEIRPAHAVVCGSGLAVAVLAAALACSGGGRVTAIDHDERSLAVTADLLRGIGVEADLIRAELTDHDRQNLWYAPWSVNRVPSGIGLLLVDGPGHFAGRTPRWPAGPALFSRLLPGAAVVLDDARRVKEVKTLARWAEDFPALVAGHRVGAAQVLRLVG